MKPNAPLKAEDQKWIEYNIGHGARSASVVRRNGLPSPNGPSAALEVEDFDAAVATLREHKVPIIIGPLDLPNCSMATVQDPDGNKLTLHHRKES